MKLHFLIKALCLVPIQVISTNVNHSSSAQNIINDGDREQLKLTTSSSLSRKRNTKMDLHHNNHIHDVPEAAKHAAETKLTEEEEVFLRYLQQEVSASYAPSAKPSNNPTKSPTPAPTPDPTPAPTPAPTKAPVSGPTSSGCIDSGVKFKRTGDAGVKKKSCKWVGKKPNRVSRRCAYKDIDSHCPVTCGTCDQFECVDSKKVFYLWNNPDTFKEKDCTWVGLSTEIRCAHRGVKSTCRKTCGYC